MNSRVETLRKTSDFGWIEALHPEDRDLVTCTTSSRPVGPVTACQGDYRVRRANGDFGWLLLPWCPASSCRWHLCGSYRYVHRHHGSQSQRAGAGRSADTVSSSDRMPSASASPTSFTTTLSSRLALVGLQLREAHLMLVRAIIRARIDAEDRFDSRCNRSRAMFIASPMISILRRLFISVSYPPCAGCAASFQSRRVSRLISRAILLYL